MRKIIALVIVTIYMANLSACSNEMTEEEAIQALEKLDLEFEECLAKMELLLDNNNAYVARKKYSSDEVKTIIEFHNSQSKDYRECALAFANKHAEAVFDVCTKLDCGRNIGGGCTHIANYSIYTSVTDAARKECTQNKPLNMDTSNSGAG